MKKIKNSFWAFTILGVGIGMSVSTLLTTRESARAANTSIYQHLDLFGDVLERVRSDYVEKPEDEKLIETAINGMLTSLDPHSSYMNAKSFLDMQTSTKGEFGGLGIEVTMEKGMVKVVTPIEDTPAYKAGVQPGDLITHLDGVSIVGLSLNDAVKKMRGPINSPIKLQIIRKGSDDPVKLTVVRDVIRIKAVKYRAEGDDIAYLRITSFNEQTYPGLEEGIKKLKAKLGDKLKGYVIDLRNNPGGLLDQAILVSDAFIDKGAIVMTRGRNAQETQRSNAKMGDLTDHKKVIVIVNGASASASEIVAGALQDHKRATIIGTRSFGKGSVQTIIPLSSKGAIRLTTARYYTPSGKSIQAKGIIPDIKVIQPLPDALKGKKMNFGGEASLRGHLKGESEDVNAKESGSSSYVPKDKAKDMQLKYALDMLRGKVAKKAEPAKKEDKDAAKKADVKVTKPDDKKDAKTDAKVEEKKKEPAPAQ